MGHPTRNFYSSRSAVFNKIYEESNRSAPMTRNIQPAPALGTDNTARGCARLKGPPAFSWNWAPFVLVGQERFNKPLQSRLKMFPHPKARPVRSGVRDQSGAGMNGVL